VKKRSYDQYCPVAEALDVVGDRWALLIVRELLVGPLRFRDLQNRLPRIPPNVLATRLRELEDAGLVARRELPPPAARTVYELTDDGRALETVIRSLARWGMRRLEPPGPDTELTPVVALRAALVAYARPRATRAVRRVWRVVVDDTPFLLHLDGGRVSISELDDGNPVDLEMHASAADLMRLRIGDLDVVTAKRRKLLSYTPARSDRIDEFERVFALDLVAA
jgi:DNA-binding HxlR family transcriptional regulator